MPISLPLPLSFLSSPCILPSAVLVTIPRPTQKEKQVLQRRVFLRQGASVAAAAGALGSEVQSFFFRIAVLGDAAVGKTCLIERYA